MAVPAEGQLPLKQRQLSWTRAALALAGLSTLPWPGSVTSPVSPLSPGAPLCKSRMSQTRCATRNVLRYGAFREEGFKETFISINIIFRSGVFIFPVQGNT